MYYLKKLTFVALVIASLFSSQVRKLVHMASNAVECEALADDDNGGSGGGTCGI